MPDSLKKSKGDNLTEKTDMPSTSASTTALQQIGGLENATTGMGTTTGTGGSDLLAGKNVGVDTLFEPSVEMMVNDFDDERTLEEEEALAATESEDPNTELSNLKRESDMPIEELLALYNCGGVIGAGSADGTAGGSGNLKKSSARSRSNSTNEDESEEQNCEEDEPSELIKLYTDQYDGKRSGDKNETNSNSGGGLEGGGSSGDQRLLRALSRPPSDDEEDGEYSPDEDDVKKTIMVGSEFQAIIPEGMLRYDDVLPYENEDKLLWDPLKMQENEIEEYLATATATSSSPSSSSPPYPEVQSVTVGENKSNRDDEQALYLLLQCGHNVEEALRRRRISNNLSGSSKSPPSSSTNMSLWSEEECRNFENGLRSYGKDFHTIREAKVRTRSVGELVQFYYLWKKTERHDVFANKARLEKKKYSLHPGVTDYMDRFLEEQENGTNTSGSMGGCGGSASGQGGLYRDRSSSPGINSLLYADTKHHHHTSIHYNGSKHCNQPQRTNATNKDPSDVNSDAAANQTLQNDETDSPPTSQTKASSLSKAEKSSTTATTSG